MSAAEERLLELLDTKDTEIDQLTEQVEELKQLARGRYGAWTMHEKLPEDQPLPVPRLEMAWEHEDEWHVVVLYRLVYRHLLGHCVGVPFGHTRVSGSGVQPLRYGRLDLPFRDGAHIRHDAESLNLPAFLIYEDHVETLAENLASWKEKHP